MSSLPLLAQLRQCSAPYPRLGHRHTQISPDLEVLPEGAVENFLAFLDRLVGDLSGDDTPVVHEGLDDLQKSGVSWTRYRQTGAFPLLVERLRVVAVLDPPSAGQAPDPVPFRRTGPGEWSVELAVLLPRASHFGNHQSAWKAAVQSWLTLPEYSGGACVNVLRIPAASLASGEVDLRPTVLRNFSPDHRAADLTRPEDQKRVANAFWQTYWATGALRSERGQTFPVAFLPIERSHPREFAPPFHERYVTLRRRLLGRSSLLAYVLESLTRARALFVHPESGRYGLLPEYDPTQAEWPCSAADVALALDELERTGWLDRHTGTNREIFSQLVDVQVAQPWPYDGETPLKIRARGPAEDFLRGRRIAAEVQSQYVRIHRIIPYAAAATLGQIFHENEELCQSGKLPDIGGKILAATNSTFFLNFAEEYGHIHSAMNDPVSVLVENGRTHQLKTLRRAAFVLTESGKPLITTRLGNHLESEVLLFEGEAVTATALRGAARPPGGNRIGPLFFGAVVVGESIVETFEESATHIPVNGWITGDSEAFGGRIQPVGAVRVSHRPAGALQEEAVRHAFAVGPLLLENGTTVTWGESREEFLPYEGPSVSAVESRELARTEIPPSMQAARQVGLPPTRFPHDWDRTRAPRTGLGVTAEGDVLLVVVDGRAQLAHSVGVSLAELAAVMAGLGCVDAMNLDGGGSSVMYVGGDEAHPYRLREDLRPGVVNLPSDLGGVERLLPVPLLVIQSAKRA